MKPIMKLLADFGLSKIMKIDQGRFSTSKSSGSLGWKGPELMIMLNSSKRRQYDFLGEYFPIGVYLWLCFKYRWDVQKNSLNHYTFTYNIDTYTIYYSNN